MEVKTNQIDILIVDTALHHILLCWILLHTKSCLIEPVTISRKAWVISPLQLDWTNVLKTGVPAYIMKMFPTETATSHLNLWYIYTRIGTTLLGSNLDSSSIGNGSFTTHPTTTTTTTKKNWFKQDQQQQQQKKHFFFSRWCTLSSPKHHPTKSSRESNLSPRGTDLWADSLIPKESWL